MAFVIPAISGRMGSTDYFVATMSARDLAGAAIIAAELPDWRQWSVFERFQREIDLARVRREMVPYLAKARDRFYSALIVLVYEPKMFEFVSLKEFGTQTPKAFETAKDAMGFLTIDGGNLVVLDGQHRLASLKEITLRGENFEGDYIEDVASDQVCVIFIGHESFEKTRRIFNKVNRYAKPTSISDNVITSEDDGSAIVARWLVEDSPPLGLLEPKPPLRKLGPDGEPIVEWRKANLTAESEKITTLNHLYQTVSIILAANGIKHFDEKHRVTRPTDAELKIAYQVAAKWWELALTTLTALKKGMRIPGNIPEMRKFQSEDSLLFKPNAQIVLFRAAAILFEKGLHIDEIFLRMNELSWRSSDEHWRDILVFGNGHIKTKDGELRLAARFTAYLLGSKLFSEDEVVALQREIRQEVDHPRYRLPEPLD
jgi:DNA sulfur modification protein DndB